MKVYLQYNDLATNHYGFMKPIEVSCIYDREVILHEVIKHYNDSDIDVVLKDGGVINIQILDIINETDVSCHICKLVGIETA